MSVWFVTHARLDCRVYSGADFKTDHRLLSVIVRAQFHGSKHPSSNPMLRYNVRTLKDEGASNAFKDSVEEAFEGDVGPNMVEETWHRFRRAIRVAATSLLALFMFISELSH